MNRCNICGTTFPLKIQLNQHLKVKHPNHADPASIEKLNTSSMVKPSSSSFQNNKSTESLENSPQIYKLTSSYNASSSSTTNINRRVNSLSTGANGFRPISSSNVISLSNTFEDCDDPSYIPSGVKVRSSFASRNPSFVSRTRTPRECKAQERLKVIRKSDRFRNTSSPVNCKDNSSGNGKNKSSHLDSPNQKVPCLICNKVLPNSKSLAIHLRKFHAKKGNNDISTIPTGVPIITRENPTLLKPLLCKKCGKRFETHNKRWKHCINICGLGTKYRCSRCPSQFRQFIDFCIHRSSHNYRGQLKLRVKHTKSDVYQRTPPTVSKVGVNKVNENSLKCKVASCLKLFDSREELCEHTAETHSLFMCLECPSVLPTQVRLLNHCSIKHGQFDSTRISSNSSTPINNTGLSEAEDRKKEESIMVNSSNNADAQQVHSEDSVSTMMACKQCKLNFTTLGQFVKHQREHQTLDHARGNSNSVVENVTNSKLTTTTSDVQTTQDDSIEDEIFSEIKNKSQAQKYSETETTSIASSSLSKEGLNEMESQRKTDLPSPFKCGICSQEFAKEKSFFYHMAQQNCKSKTYNYTCDECQQGFTREASYNQHIISQHVLGSDESSDNDTYDESSYGTAESDQLCNICDKTFATFTSLSRHMATIHSKVQHDSTPELKRFSPPRNSPSPSPLLKSRLNNQSNNIKRASNVAARNRKHSLTLESRNDASSKLGKLLHNGAKGAGSKIFRSVRKTGVSQKFFKCPICGLGGFKIRSDIVSHIRKTHPKIGDFGCPFNGCTTVCKTALQMYDHVAVVHEKDEVDVPHSRPLPSISPPLRPPPVVVRNAISKVTFPCMEVNCGEAFSSLFDLSDHLEDSHPGNKFSICSRPDCRIPFRSMKLLQKHILEAHGKNN